MTIKRHLAYLKYVIRHKVYVWQEGRKINVPVYLLFLHDWSKFLPGEWFSYARTFYDKSGKKHYSETVSFTYAWNGHQKRNKHHYQYWMLHFDRGETRALEMPDKYRREMLADWRGASRCTNGCDKVIEWYLKNKENIVLHKETRKWIEEQLGVNHA